MKLARMGLVDPRLRATFSPALPSDCCAIVFPGRAMSPGEGRGFESFVEFASRFAPGNLSISSSFILFSPQDNDGMHSRSELF